METESWVEASSSRASQIVVSRGKEEIDSPIICGICKEIFNTLRSLRRHNEAVHNDEKFICGQCDREFGSCSKLSKHVKIHSTKSRWNCFMKNCDRSFGRRDLLMRHLKGFHHKGNFICAVCFESFAFKGSLAVHHSLHQDQHRYFCDQCSKGFENFTNYCDHVREHLQLMPFLCGACGQSFHSRSKCERHIRKDHQTDSSLPYCRLCNKHFKNTITYIKHNATLHGTTKRCIHCAKTFADDMKLQHIEATHCCTTAQAPPSPSDLLL